MPKNKSNFSRYKIPDNLNPSGICCICVPVPDDREWRAQFMGAIWRMSLQTHYERDDAHSAKIVAAKWRQIWEELTVAQCCGDEVRDVTINTSINVQNQLFLFQLNQLYIAAGFDIDVAFPLTPDNFDSDPGDPPERVDQRTRALCLACESWINEVCNRGLSWIEGQKEEVAGVIAVGVASGLVPVYAIIGAFVGLGVLAGTVILQLADRDYRAYLACALFIALTGEDSNDPAAFRAALDNPPARPPPPQDFLQDGARDLIEVWIRTQLQSTDNYLGFISLLNAAMGAADVLTDEDCVCTETETWCFEIDFTATDGGFVSTGICNFGVYVPGTGWVSEASGPAQSICVHRELGDFTLTHAEITVFTDEVLSGPGSGRALQGKRLAVTIFTEWGSQAAGVQTTIWNGDELLDQLVFNPSGQGPTEGGIILTHGLFSGTGANPFGVDNC